MKQYVEQRIEQDVNPGLARYEQIKKVALLPAELSVAALELTPTMKVRRKVVAERHAALIAGLFAGDASGPPPEPGG
jgi:long-subunit acyl-CoA synthetase (AMP-forming)